MSQVRTRFAPSPTGFLHLGSARTALFNWAFARHHQGAYLLRIEDTDRERSTAESEAALLDGLDWLALEHDGPVYRQSESAPRHAAVIDQLLTGGRAYRCICTREELEERKQKTIAAGNKWTYDGRCRDAELDSDCGAHTVRLRLDPEQELRWEDGVYGPLGQPAGELGDMIIRRSDGGALYNLAVVVDDIDMQITHVIRGADHQVNTAFQLAIYSALEQAPPAFAHLPLIVNDKGKKLSKRRDPVAVQQFREDGFLADAMRNWLVRIGWSHGDQEIFSADEIAEFFDLDAVGRAAGQADLDKLRWLNQQYLKAMPADELGRAVLPFVERSAGRPVAPSDGLAKLCELLRERAQTLAEMAEQALWIVRNAHEIEYDEKAAKKHLKPAAGPVLEALHEALGALQSWDEASLEAAFEQVRTALGDVGMGKLAQPVRVAITGSAASPGIFETLVALGQAQTVARIGRAVAWVAAQPAA